MSTKCDVLLVPYQNHTVFPWITVHDADANLTLVFLGTAP